ncbi:MAG: TfoX/Sxy family protein [Acidobacteria bacterium]|nr:TfoX/Sxy family protein [Acidobacteriota bacterium]
MAYDEKLAGRIRRAIGARRDVTERQMFGGLAFMCRGRMCCGIVGCDLMVRVAGDEFAAVMRLRHVRPMDFTGRPLRGFVYVSPPGLRTAAALRRWLSRGLRVTGTAQPAKSSSRRHASPAGGVRATRPMRPRSL